MHQKVRRPRMRCPYRLSTLAVAATLVHLHAPTQAMDIPTGNPDLRFRIDNTVRYTAAARVKERSPALATTVFGPTPGTFVGTNNINQDDGDNNFNRGIVSSRFDLLSEMDFAYKGLGARVVAAAWYDQAYNRGNDNTTTTANKLGPANEFLESTRRLMGRKAEFLDAFVYGGFEVGGLPVNLRLGRHTLLWGESLFFGANGIAGGMAPIDVIKATSVPNSTFKEIGMPTGKLSGQVQLSQDTAVGAYLAYEWKPSRLLPTGAYLSSGDPLGAGGEVLRAGPTVLTRAADAAPPDSGQGGVQLRVRADSIDTDFGFYAIRFHALTPSNNNFNGAPPPAGTQYRFLYHEGVKAFGVSAARTFDNWGLAAEASYRQNAPLASAPQARNGFVFDNDQNPGYAVGETAHVQFSWLASLGPSFIAKEASFNGEIAWNTRVKFTRNETMANANATRSATAIRAVYTPTYRQAIAGLDLSPSVGLGYAWGKSSALGPGFGVDKGGDLSLGLGGVYLGVWNVNLNYVVYLGPEGGPNDNAGVAQFKQANKDRNFVSLSLRTSF